MGGMSGADISESLPPGARAEGAAGGGGGGPAESLVSTEDLLAAIDAYKGVRGVVEKIRYGQYL